MERELGTVASAKKEGLLSRWDGALNVFQSLIARARTKTGHLGMLREGFCTGEDLLLIFFLAIAVTPLVVAVCMKKTTPRTTIGQ